MKSKGIFTRILCALMCTIMVISLIPMTVGAVSAVVFDVDDVKLALDGTDVGGYYTVDVPVKVTENSGLNATQLM